ncbi:MAG: hypothetical protein QXT65_04570 [Candidatus Nitrosocaldaceae archaeon]
MATIQEVINYAFTSEGYQRVMNDEQFDLKLSFQPVTLSYNITTFVGETLINAINDKEYVIDYKTATASIFDFQKPTIYSYLRYYNQCNFIDLFHSEPVPIDMLLLSLDYAAHERNKIDMAVFHILGYAL